MFEYQKFDIIKVAEKCGIKINTRTLDRAEVEAWCPFCTTESSDYHLYLNREQEQFYCQKCATGGNSVTLYARIYGVDNREASKRLSGGLDYALPDSHASERPRNEQKLPGYAPASIRQRHDAYFSMLEMMGLSVRHMRDLTDRGLSRERIETNMYRSMPISLSERRKIAFGLAKIHDLRGVPGFYYSGGRWELCGKPGILIPILDVRGYIQGLQIRLDNAVKRKYRWLSSNPEYDLPYGTPSSAWIHVTGNRDNGEAFITEGGLKGDIASYLSGDRLFVCTAGANSIRYLPEVFTSLNIRKVNGCYDMDKVTELNVLLQKRRDDPRNMETKKPCPLERMEASVQSAGLPYTRCVWASEQNGIDDFYFDSLRRQGKQAA